MKSIVATFSIVGFDPSTEELGVAVQSKFLAVGAVVPWARAGVGAVATQALANPTYGPRGLELMSHGATAEDTVETLVNEDTEKADRQLGIVDACGRSAIFTGESCFDWAGGIAGDNFAAQGNILVGKETVVDMARVFQDTTGQLAYRLAMALEAGQDAGGDSRGRQSAALLVVREKGGYGGYDDRVVDLRVDDHPEPIEELMRLHSLHKLYFGETKQDEAVALDTDVRERVVGSLKRLGYLREDPDDEALNKSLSDFIRTENFEAREQNPGYVDPEVLKFMENR